MNYFINCYCIFIIFIGATSCCHYLYQNILPSHFGSLSFHKHSGHFSVRQNVTVDTKSDFLNVSVQDMNPPIQKIEKQTNISELILNSSSNSSNTILVKNTTETLNSVIQDSKEHVENSNNASTEIPINLELNKTQLTNDLLVGNFMYAYLNGTFPEKNEVKYLPYTRNLLPISKNTSQVFYYQHEIVVNKFKRIYAYQNRTMDIPLNQHFSVYSLPEFEDPLHPFDSLTLVGFIKSRPINKVNRRALRATSFNSTYISKSLGTFKFYFVMGIDNVKPEMLQLLLSEQKKYKDIILLNVPDLYEFLLLKTIMAEDIFHAYNSTTPYYYSGDDDTCICVHRLLLYIKNHPQTKGYIGFAYPSTTNVPPFNEKHSLPKIALDHTVPFAFGPGYLMTGSLVHCHMNIFRSIPTLNHVDDQVVALLSDFCGTKLQDHRWWVYGDYHYKHPHNIWFKQSQAILLHSTGTGFRIYRICSDINRF
ncbi:hypothetical protein WA158_002272 [Blastocystis sp. Blastoise]